jgi:hypothetical protein
MAAGCPPCGHWAGHLWNGHQAIFAVACLHGVEGSGMMSPSDTLGSSCSPLANSTLDSICIIFLFSCVNGNELHHCSYVRPSVRPPICPSVGPTDEVLAKTKAEDPPSNLHIKSNFLSCLMWQWTTRETSHFQRRPVDNYWGLIDGLMKLKTWTTNGTKWY